jgi:phosphoribosyl 1,2-cyclic phosphodiesterase
VAGPRERILIDMGFTQRRITAHLADEGLAPSDLDAVFITHTHGDHARDATLKFCWRHKVPLVAPSENLSVLRRRFGHVCGKLDRADLLRKLPPSGLHVNGLDIRGFHVPHDAEGVTLGYHLTLGNGSSGEPTRVAVATDLGEVPPEALGAMASADVLILESNHDDAMLAASDRPAFLIDRIRGPEGHLSNEQTAWAVEEILAHQEPGHLKQLVLAHLSDECNTPTVARRTMREMLKPLGDAAPRLMIAHQDKPLTVLSGRGR